MLFFCMFCYLRTKVFLKVFSSSIPWMDFMFPAVKSVIFRFVKKGTPKWHKMETFKWKLIIHYQIFSRPPIIANKPRQLFRTKSPHFSPLHHHPTAERWNKLAKFPHIPPSCASCPRPDCWLKAEHQMLQSATVSTMRPTALWFLIGVGLDRKVAAKHKVVLV